MRARALVVLVGCAAHHRPALYLGQHPPPGCDGHTATARCVGWYLDLLMTEVT